MQATHLEAIDLLIGCRKDRQTDKPLMTSLGDTALQKENKPIGFHSNHGHLTFQFGYPNYLEPRNSMHWLEFIPTSTYNYKSHILPERRQT